MSPSLFCSLCELVSNGVSVGLCRCSFPCLSKANHVQTHPRLSQTAYAIEPRQAASLHPKAHDGAVLRNHRRDRLPQSPRIFNLTLKAHHEHNQTRWHDPHSSRRVESLRPIPNQPPRLQDHQRRTHRQACPKHSLHNRRGLRALAHSQHGLNPAAIVLKSGTTVPLHFGMSGICTKRALSEVALHIPILF